MDPQLLLELLDENTSDSPHDEKPASLLIVTNDAQQADLISTALEDESIRIELAQTIAQACVLLADQPHDVAIVGSTLVDGVGLTLIQRLAKEHITISAMLVSSNPSLDETIEAMRCGAVDVLSNCDRPAVIRERILAAIAKSRRAQSRQQRVDRLKTVCKRLDRVRHEITRQVGSLCTDLVDAYRDLSDQVAHIGDTKEFESLIRQELDIESLLRTVLEYVLSKTGPTNAAVYLPSTAEDFSLGAYVNYDRDRETVEVLLDHLAGVLAPKFESNHSLVLCKNIDDVEALLGEHAHWIGDCQMITFACHHDGECLAVVTFFRDRSSPFTDEAVSLLEALCPLLARQLSQVIYVHHRHLPKHLWGTFSDTDDDELDDFDDLDLAA